MSAQSERRSRPFGMPRRLITERVFDFLASASAKTRPAQKCEWGHYQAFRRILEVQGREDRCRIWCL